MATQRQQWLRLSRSTATAGAARASLASPEGIVAFVKRGEAAL